MADDTSETTAMMAAVAAPWSRAPQARTVPPAPRTLNLCSTASQACTGAVTQEPAGFAVAVTEEDGILRMRWAEATVFGTADRTKSAPERAFIEAVVIDTLQSGEKDVWLACTIPAVLRDLTRRAERLGHTVASPENRSASVRDPFSLFSACRVRGRSASGSVMSFCELDPLEHEPLKVGDTVRMACEVLPDGGTMVGYTDASGWLVGLHGRMPMVLDEQTVERLSEVSVAVSYVSWGRSWRSGRLRDMQFLVFDIPSDVDALLGDAKLPRGRGGAHL